MQVAYRLLFWAGVFLLSLAGSGSVSAADLDLFPDWHFSGSNTLRYDNYNSFGDRTSSPYFYAGPQSYDEFSLNFDRSFSPFNLVSGQVGLLFNDSRYRSEFFGPVPEILSLKQENGGFVVPYRADIGDYYGYFSMRTMQRTLKGVQVEFQPGFGESNNSLVLFSGGGAPTWRNFQLEDDWSNGASWVVSHPRFGVLGANFVLNNQQGDLGRGITARQQYVYSMVWEKQGEFLNQNFTIEGEAGRFVGDHPDMFFIGDGLNREGNGYFAQLSGSPVALPALAYRLRFDAYEQNYKPAGAAVEADRRSTEIHSSWIFDNGMVVRSRLQNFHTGWQTDNPVDSITYGGNLSGSLLSDYIESLSLSIDVFGQDVESRDLFFDTMTKSANVSISKGLGDWVSARAGFYYLNIDDKTFFVNGSTITRQADVAMDFKVDAFGITGTVSPGFLVRRQDTGGVKDLDINPTMNLSLNRDRHQLSLSYAVLDQKRVQNDMGLVTRTAGGSYRYTMDQLSVGVDVDWFERNPDSAFFRRTDAWRVGAFLTYSFDKPARLQPIQTVESSSPDPVEVELVTSRFAVDITSLQPGMGLEDAINHIQKSGLGKPAKQAGFLIWYRRILKELNQNQRLVLDWSGDTVKRSSVIIEFDDTGNAGDVRSIFEDARKLMLQKYGRPDAFFDQGEFDHDIEVNLTASRFIRVMEWRLENGILRFGIPRRMDGKVRMELQFARKFPPLKDPLWGMGQIQ